MIYIQDIDELSDLIKNTRIDNLKNTSTKTIVAVGENMSQGEQTMGTIRISLRDMNDLTLEDDGTLIVTGNIRCDEILNFLNLRGRSFIVSQAGQLFSLPGSLAANIHGWNVGHTFGDIVKWVSIVDEMGDVHLITPQSDLFKHICGGFGQVGIIVSVAIRTTINRKMNYRSYFIKRNQIGSTLEKIIADHRDEDDTVLIRVYGPDNIQVQYYFPDITSARLVSLLPPSYRPSYNIKLMSHFIIRGRFDKMMNKQYKKERADGGPKERNKILSYSNMMEVYVKSLKMDLQEYFIPLRNIDEFYNDIIDLISKSNWIINASIRYIRAHGHSHFTKIEEDTAAFVVAFKRCPNTRDSINIMTERALYHGGKYNTCYGMWQTDSMKKQNLIGKGFYKDTPTIFDNNFIKEMKKLYRVEKEKNY